MPWCVILGNHDCMIDPEAQVRGQARLLQGRRGLLLRPSVSGAQVAYTGVDPRGLWRMPARTYGFTCGGASFFGVDTCGCQHSVQRADPASVERLDRDIAALGVALAAADPTKPKVVFGHHTLYTKGLGHLDEAKCLRLPSYSFRPPVRTQGGGGLPEPQCHSRRLCCCRRCCRATCSR